MTNGGTRGPIEAALRFLGAQRYGTPVELIELAIKLPTGINGQSLGPIVTPLAALEGWSTGERAHALWRVIQEGVVSPEVGPTAQSRRRRVLQAAFRLPDQEIDGEWGSSLTDRFKQLKVLKRVFNNPTTTQPMEFAWKRGVASLAAYIEDRFVALENASDWDSYKRDQSPAVVSPPTEFRQASEGAQKLLVNFMVVTVILNGRSPRRRIVERLITSRDPDGLEFFISRAFSSSSSGSRHNRDYVPTAALWGCRAVDKAEDEFPTTQLWFPEALRMGEQRHFAAEVVYPDGEPDLYGWCNVEVDHHGVEPGSCFPNGIPITGLTVRVQFDPDEPPNAVWWYAEQNETERYAEPKPSSPRRIPITGCEAVKTFESACQPRENYGIAYTWDTRRGQV